MMKENQDRLSQLHDSLIIEILCYMELKDLVKTSVLSKRLNQLWTEVDTITCIGHSAPVFKFSSSTDHIREQEKRYVSSVYKTLTRRFSRIRNFSVVRFGFLSPPSVSHLVDEWIEYALELKVETLNIDYGSILYSCCPRSLFQSSSLTQLTLSKCRGCGTSPVNLSLLKSLSLNSIHLPHVHLEDLLGGCPVLETLVLTDITWYHDVRIISPSLKKLKMVFTYNFSNNVEHNLEIRAPLLHELEISSRLIIGQCVTDDFSSLVKANLMFTICEPILDDSTKFNKDWIYMVEELLKSICLVSELLIGGHLLQVLTLSALLHKPLPTFMCKHVTVVSPLWEYDLPGIVHLLQVAPHLETLFVHVSEHKNIPPFDQVKEALSAAQPQLEFIHATGNLLHLKNVKLSYQRNPCVDDCPPLENFQMERVCLDFEFIDYILRSCISLERLVVCSSETKCLKTSQLLTRSLDSDAEWQLKKRKFTLEYTSPNYASIRFDV